MSKWWFRIPILPQIVVYWRVFREFSGNQLILYIALSFLATLLEGVGITFFFPLLSQLSGSAPVQEAGASSRYMQAIETVFSFVGVSMSITALLVGILIIFFVKAILQSLSGTYQSFIITRFLATISERVFSGYTEVGYSYFLKTNVGTLANILMNESSRAMSSLVRYASLFPPMITIVIFTGIALTVDWRLTAFAVIFGGFLLVLFKSLSSLSRKFSFRLTDEVSRLSSLSIQSLSSFKYLASTSSFKPLRNQVSRAIQKMTNTQYKLSVTANLSQAVNEPSIVFFMVALVWYQTVHRGRPISEVFVMVLFFYRLIKEVMSLQLNWNGFCSTMGSLDLVTRTISETAVSREAHGSKKISTFDRGIRFDNVTFSYGDRPVLQRVTMDIPKNQTVAIVGESGAGKSTFVDLVTGLLSARSGEIRIDDTPYSEIDMRHFRTSIGYVTQEGALFDDTVANNICLWSCDSNNPKDLERIRRAAEIANCIEFIENMPQGFHSIIGERGVVLSGGQKQRLAIAREIFKEPALLILDEATSALDTKNEREIQKSIDHLKGKTTVIIIAHRLSTIRGADCIFVLNEGKVVEQGTFHELNQRAGSEFNRICQMQGLVTS